MAKRIWNRHFWVRKASVLSLILHGAALSLPWPSEPLPIAKEETGNELLADSPLPAIAIESLSARTAPSVSGQAIPNKSKSNEPSSTVASAVQSTVVPSPSIPSDLQSDPQSDPQSVIQSTQPIQPAQPAQSTAEPMQPKPLAEQQTESRSPTQSPTANGLTSVDLPPPLNTELEHDIALQLGDNFPHLAGAQSGCYGLQGCRQLSGNYRQAARQLIEQMEAQGYQLAERTDIDDTGHRVFTVVPPNEPNNTYYLNVFSPDVGSTVYILTMDILSLEQLKQLNS